MKAHDRARIVEELEVFAPSPIAGQKLDTASATKLAEIATVVRQGIETIANREYWILKASTMRDLVLFCTPKPKTRPPMGGMSFIEPEAEHGANPIAAKALKKLLEQDASIRVKVLRDQSPVLRYGGKLRTRVLLAAVDLLEAEGDRIGRCLSCEKLFVRRKRGAYCSPACSTKTRSALFRMRHRQKLRKKRREYYERRIRREYGEKVVIHRRQPRRTNDQI